MSETTNRAGPPLDSLLINAPTSVGVEAPAVERLLYVRVDQARHVPEMPQQSLRVGVVGLVVSWESLTSHTFRDWV